MLNWRGYQALRQNSGRYWCRNARWPYAIDRARSQSVFRKASYVGLWAQPINGSGDDRGLCTTLLKCFGLDTPHPIYHIGNRFARDVHRESSGNDAREKSVKKKKEKGKLARDSIDDQYHKRWKIDRRKHPFLYRICMLRSSYNPHDASPTRSSIKAENKSYPPIC